MVHCVCHDQENENDDLSAITEGEKASDIRVRAARNRLRDNLLGLHTIDNESTNNAHPTQALALGPEDSGHLQLKFTNTGGSMLLRRANEAKEHPGVPLGLLESPDDSQTDAKDSKLTTRASTLDQSSGVVT